MRRRVLLGAAVLVAVLGLGGAVAVAFFSRSSGTVSAEVTAYTSAPPYKVTFEVDKPPADTVSCDIYAIDFDDNAVGSVKGIRIGPSAQRSQRYAVTVPTTRRPTQFQVEQCLVQH